MTIHGLQPSQLRDVILSVGTHHTRRRLTPVEVANHLAAALDAGASLNELAQVLRLDPSMIRRITRLVRLPERIQDLVGWSSSSTAISMSAAADIARLSADHDQCEVARAVLEARLRPGEVKQVIQTRQRSGRPIGECIEAAIRLRPTVERQFAFIGAVTVEWVRRTLAGRTQEQRDAALRQALTERHSAMPDWSGRLGPRGFALVGGEPFAEWVESLADGFEAEVNSCLEEHA